ncbi:hypothetical protein L3Q82_015449 [Scortum barcoo]|uniref:Uncharacterized protein n=1 Tax=Scortum barcoo TaxID=214431 RepID=A0ACB8VP91_9TELE|nr:hypothetical protein L3Q82_015449 [Scortum barcoo]
MGSGSETVQPVPEEAGAGPGLAPQSDEQALRSSGSSGTKPKAKELVVDFRRRSHSQSSQQRGKPSPLLCRHLSSRNEAKNVSKLKALQPVPTHITQSPFASAKKDAHVLQAENQKLFTEFVEHCLAVTQDCPEVLTFLQTKHSKASPDYLSSVEFRNTLGRCLTRAQANRSKILCLYK